MERANGSNHGGKKMSIITGFSMFFLSFFPLWISVLFLDIKSICEGNPNIRTEAISVLLILIVSIISLIILMLEFNPKNMQGSQEYSIITAIEEKTITAVPTLKVKLESAFRDGSQLQLHAEWASCCCCCSNLNSYI